MEEAGDPYAVLGIGLSASLAEVKAAKVESERVIRARDFKSIHDYVQSLADLRGLDLLLERMLRFQVRAHRERLLAHDPFARLPCAPAGAPSPAGARGRRASRRRRRASSSARLFSMRKSEV